MKKLVVVALVLVVAGLGAWYKLKSDKTPKDQFRFAKIESGDLEALVSSTGTLSAVSTVQVGTQVSGTLAQILVDFNQKVRQGQLLAVLDTTFLATAVRDAEASYERARVQLEHGDQEYRRLQSLFDKGLSAQSDLELAKYSRDLARSGLKSAQASLERARINLRFAWIWAPIDGTVIDRKVDGGQTVAANFSAPTLFLIANDLAKMQILANVDESDIGQIAEAQQVRFTVQAYPERRFAGQVAQIRLQPTTIQNVVNYTVVINVANQEGLLLPGMTATVDFLIERAEGVLKVANAALRFRPTSEMLAAFRQQRASVPGGPETGGERPAPPGAGAAGGQAWGAPRPDGFSGLGGSAAPAGVPHPGSVPGWEGSTPSPAALGLVWCLDGEGRLRPVRVVTGITDGRMTEISSPEVTEGMKVINGLAQGSTSSAGSGFVPGPGPFPGGGPPPPGGGRMF